MVVHLDHLPEGSLPDDLEHLVAVLQVVVRDVRVAALIVVVAAVVGRADDARALLGVGADEVDLRVVEDLVVLVGGQLVHVELHDLFRGGHHRLGLDRPRGGIVGRLGRRPRGRADRRGRRRGARRRAVLVMLRTLPVLLRGRRRRGVVV